MLRKSVFTILLITVVLWTVVACFIFSWNFGKVSRKGIGTQYRSHLNTTTSLHKFKEVQGKTSNDSSIIVIPILVIACHRVEVAKCINDLIKYRQNVEQFPIYVSQGCRDPEVRKTIFEFGDRINFIRNHDATVFYFPNIDYTKIQYYNIALHYKRALQMIFKRFKYDVAIIVEDDMIISPDFYEYFLGTYSLLLHDESLFCVSAWNDNGAENLVDTNHPELLHRTDFFPGLGWMLLKKFWEELEPKWPNIYWDDWLRLPDQRLGRSCIRPEISRTHTFGRKGASNGLFYNNYLSSNFLNNKFVPFTELNLTYMLKHNYDRDFFSKVGKSSIIGYQDVLSSHLKKTTDEIRIEYKTDKEFALITKSFGLMSDLRADMPRTTYNGVINFFFKGTRFYLTSTDWKEDKIFNYQVRST